MSRLMFITLLLSMLLLTGANQSAQVRCLMCPDIDSIVKETGKPFIDSLLNRVNSICEKQDSALRQLDTKVRREYIQLLSGRWRYDWFYVNGDFYKLVKTKL